MYRAVSEYVLSGFDPTACMLGTFRTLLTTDFDFFGFLRGMGFSRGFFMSMDTDFWERWLATLGGCIW